MQQNYNLDKQPPLFHPIHLIRQQFYYMHAPKQNESIIVEQTQLLVSPIKSPTPWLSFVSRSFPCTCANPTLSLSLFPHASVVLHTINHSCMYIWVGTYMCMRVLFLFLRIARPPGCIVCKWGGFCVISIWYGDGGWEREVINLKRSCLGQDGSQNNQVDCLRLPCRSMLLTWDLMDYLRMERKRHFTYLYTRSYLLYGWSLQKM